MATRIILAIIFMTLLCGPSMGQGFMDSVLGPGGLGLWGGPSSGQFNYQQYQQGTMYPGGQQGMQGQTNQQPYQEGPQGGYPPAGYGYQMPPYATQQGVYSDWHVNQPAAPQGPPPVQYSAPGPPQAVYGQQAPELRPGQYSPSYPQPQLFDENLPAGAVRITTTTPDGTTVQYYPPSDDPENQQVNQRPQRRQKPRTASRQAAPKPQQQTGEQLQSSSTPQTGGSIAMPRPVEIPQEQDPRAGWGAALNRAPASPSAR